jgi:hypothetical protein
MFEALIHLADSQTRWISKAREVKKKNARPEKIQPSLPKAFADMKHANCSTIH